MLEVDRGQSAQLPNFPIRKQHGRVRVAFAGRLHALRVKSDSRVRALLSGDWQSHNSRVRKDNLCGMGRGREDRIKRVIYPSLGFRCNLFGRYRFQRVVVEDLEMGF
jgi:hypothetical protein